MWDGTLANFDANELLNNFSTPLFTNAVGSSQSRFVMRVDGYFDAMEFLVLSRFVFQPLENFACCLERLERKEW